MNSASSVFDDLISLETRIADGLRNTPITMRISKAIVQLIEDWTGAVWTAACETGPADLLAHADSDPVFILGSPRSGPTLLRSLFDGHPDLNVIPFETEYFLSIQHKADALPAGQRAEFVLRRFLANAARSMHLQRPMILGLTTA